METNTLNALCSVFNISRKNRYIYIPEKDINLTVTKDNGMTVIKHCDNTFINMLLQQNNADLIEFCYGCMLDNSLYCCNNGYLSINESYLNEWSSDYTVYFSRDCMVYDKFFNDYSEEIKAYSNEL